MSGSSTMPLHVFSRQNTCPGTCLTRSATWTFGLISQERKVQIKRNFQDLFFAPKACWKPKMAKSVRADICPLREYRFYVLFIRYRKEVDALNINKQAQGQYFLRTLLHLIFLYDS